MWSAVPSGTSPGPLSRDGQGTGMGLVGDDQGMGVLRVSGPRKGGVMTIYILFCEDNLYFVFINCEDNLYFVFTLLDYWDLILNFVVQGK